MGTPNTSKTPPKTDVKFSLTLSEEQKAHLLKQNDVPLDQCMDAEEVYQQVKQKYEL